MPEHDSRCIPRLIHGSHTNRSEARLVWLRFLRTFHCLLLVCKGAEETNSHLVIPNSAISTPSFHSIHFMPFKCSSLPSEPRGVPGNIPIGNIQEFLDSRESVAQHGTNQTMLHFSQTRCLPSPQSIFAIRQDSQIRSCPRPQRRRMACTRLLHTAQVSHHGECFAAAPARPRRAGENLNRCRWPAPVCPALMNAPSIHSLGQAQPVQGQCG
jgi:hypothetical protein